MGNCNDLINEIKAEIDKKGKVSLGVESHNGTCWYIADIKEFAEEKEAIKFVKSLLKEDVNVFVND